MFEAVWWATSSDRQDKLYYNKALLGTVYYVYFVLKYNKVFSKQY